MCFTATVTMLSILTGRCNECQLLVPFKNPFPWILQVLPQKESFKYNNDEDISGESTMFCNYSTANIILSKFNTGQQSYTLWIFIVHNMIMNMSNNTLTTVKPSRLNNQLFRN